MDGETRATGGLPLGGRRCSLPRRRALRRPQAGPRHCPVWEPVVFGLCLSFPIDGALFTRSGVATACPGPTPCVPAVPGPSALRGSLGLPVVPTQLFTPARRNSHPASSFPARPIPFIWVSDSRPFQAKRSLFNIRRLDPQPNGCYGGSAF